MDKILERVAESGTDSVVVTGGEPLMWNLDYLCRKLKENNYLTFLETSGAYRLTGEWDWVCLSPKINRTPLDELWQAADERHIQVEDFELKEALRDRKDADPESVYASLRRRKALDELFHDWQVSVILSDKEKEEGR